MKIPVVRTTSVSRMTKPIERGVELARAHTGGVVEAHPNSGMEVPEGVCGESRGNFKSRALAFLGDHRLQGREELWTGEGFSEKTRNLRC